MRVKSSKYAGAGRHGIGGEGAAAMAGGLAVTTDQIQVAIKDARGRTVRTVTMGRPATGDGPLLWEGKEDNNTALPAGIYSFSVNVVKGSGSCA